MEHKPLGTLFKKYLFCPFFSYEQDKTYPEIKRKRQTPMDSMPQYVILA